MGAEQSFQTKSMLFLFCVDLLELCLVHGVVLYGLHKLLLHENRVVSNLLEIDIRYMVIANNLGEAFECINPFATLFSGAVMLTGPLLHLGLSLVMFKYWVPVVFSQFIWRVLLLKIVFSLTFPVKEALLRAWGNIVMLLPLLMDSDTNVWGLLFLVEQAPRVEFCLQKLLDSIKKIKNGELPPILLGWMIWLQCRKKYLYSAVTFLQVVLLLWIIIFRNLHTTLDYVYICSASILVYYEYYMQFEHMDKNS